MDTYEKKYNEAIKRAKQHCANYVVETIFPELKESKESEDERIRQFLIHEVTETSDEIMSYRNMNKKDVLAWLEAHGEPYTKRDIDDAYLKGVTNTKNEIEKQYEANYQIRKDIATFIFNYKGDIKDRAKWIDYLGIKVSFVEKQGEQKPVIEMKTPEESLGIDSETYNKIVDECIYDEQKPANKVEPKFHEGEWVVYEYGEESATLQITRIVGETYVFSDDSTLGVVDEDTLRLWDITKDAKDGDLIYVSTEEKGVQAIFHEYKNGIIFFHCYLCGDFAQGGYMPIGSVELVCPLQKTNYNRFFVKMKEAGYEWDAEKKELKKIEQTYAELGDDEGKQKQDVSIQINPSEYINDMGGNGCYLKSATQASAWGEEDERKINYLIALLQNNTMNHDALRVMNEEVESWLKSIKDRCTWKPSDEQVDNK